MKIGLKIFPDKLRLIEQQSDLFDFFEVYAYKGLDLDELKLYSDHDITIHACHQGHGFFPSLKNKTNKEILDIAIQAADIVDSPWIIVHPGFKHDEHSEQNMIDFFKDNWDKRLIFENCITNDIHFNNSEFLFSRPEEMKKLLKIFNTKMLFDFSHACVTANDLKRDVIKTFDEFFALNPKAYHICGFEMDARFDNHGHLFDAAHDYSFLKKIPKEKYISLETPHQDFFNRELQKKDIAVIKNVEAETFIPNGF